MCGIVGWYATESAHGPPPSRERLRRATALLAHRGPDGEGLWLSPDGVCGLGHRRLAVLDPEGGAQPMATPDGRWHVSFNGEIFNYLDLRREMEASGEAFRTRSDTEALLRLVARRGPAAPDRLRGPFAFAAYDVEERTLLLARDATGEKPLFTAEHRGRLYFASTLDALLEVGDLPRDIDPEALSLYLAFSYVPAPWTIYRVARKLAAGHLRRATPGDPGRPEAWWKLRPAGTFGGRFEDAVEALRAGLTAATRRRLLADVPVGLFLSGGLDSAVVAAAVAEAAPGTMAFTVRHPDPALDESRAAAAIARHLGLPHEILDAVPPGPESLRAVLSEYGEPFGDASAAVTSAVARAAAGRVKVALTGDGGDEILGGYHRHVYLSLVDSLPRGLATAARAVLPGRKIRRALALAALPEAHRYNEMYDCFGSAGRERLLRPAFRQRHGDLPREWLSALYADTGGIDAVDRMLRTDVLTHLPDFMNVKVDVATMAAGLEARSPFQEREILEFGLSLPSWFKVRGLTGKRILRAVLARSLPRPLVARKKMGFAAPVDAALRGPLRGEAERLLAPGGPLAALDAVEPEYPPALLREYAEGGVRHRLRVWVLLALASWVERAAARCASPPR